MKTPDEIKRGAELCADGSDEGFCMSVCPYRGGAYGLRCIEALAKDCLGYIRQLEARVAELEHVKKERDRYWAFIKGMGCESCSGDCDKCVGGSAWTWSGEVVE